MGNLIIGYDEGIEKALLEKGFDKMAIDEKNSLVVVLSIKEGSDYTFITPDYILDYHRKLKKDEMNQACEDTICAGFTALNGHIYRTNRDDQTNMIGQKDKLDGDPTISIVAWKTEDSDYINHTREEWLSIYSQAFDFKQQQLFKYAQLKKDIAATTSHPEIIAIKWV